MNTGVEFAFCEKLGGFFFVFFFGFFFVFKMEVILMCFCIER